MNKTTEALKLAEEALNAMLTHMGMDEDEWTKPTFNQAREALAAIREARAEQEKQEPVAWMFQPPDKRISPMFDVMAHGGKWQPLYTAPPQREWVSLTDDEKMDSYCDLPGFRQYVAAYFAGAEWAEAKLKEKNK